MCVCVLIFLTILFPIEMFPSFSAVEKKKKNNPSAGRGWHASIIDGLIAANSSRLQSTYFLKMATVAAWRHIVASTFSLRLFLSLSLSLSLPFKVSLRKLTIDLISGCRYFCILADIVAIVAVCVCVGVWKDIKNVARRHFMLRTLSYIYHFFS